MSSYAEVAATNAPPPSKQPHPDPNLLNTTPSPAPTTADDMAKVSVVSPTGTPQTSTPPADMEFPEYEKPSESPSPSPMPGTSKRSQKSKYEKRLREMKAEGTYICDVAKHYLLRPGVAGGLVGLFNIGCLACVGNMLSNRPGLRRDYAFLGKTVSASIALLTLEGFAFNKKARKDAKGKMRQMSPSPPPGLPAEESRNCMKALVYHPAMFKGAVGVVNMAILGTLGYFTYVNWDKPSWDRRVISTVALGLFTLWGGEGCLLAQESTSENDDE